MNNAARHTIHIVVGPTASGKSARAIELAKQYDGIVINADSMQIYDGLPMLTAQPTANDKEIVPHVLYGALHPDEQCSAGKWRLMAGAAIEDALQKNKTPVIVGGTGLYIKALLEGLSEMPLTPPEIREATNKLQAELGNPGFHEALAKRDPVMAARFHPNHTARLIRAYEVLDHTGRSLSEWQKEAKHTPPENWDFKIHKILPERKTLHARCDERFLQMLENGVLEEVSAFNRQIKDGKIAADCLLAKSLGYRPLRDHLAGKISLEEAIMRAQAETRQYAKRQVTWFKNQL